MGAGEEIFFVSEFGNISFARGERGFLCSSSECSLEGEAAGPRGDASRDHEDTGRGYQQE